MRINTRRNLWFLDNMKYLQGLIISIAAVFAPIKGTLIATGVLIFADLALGMWAAKKRGEPITSAGIRRTLTKCFVYEAALMLGFLGEHYLTDSIPAVKVISGLVMITEMTSILENLNTISGSDLLKSVLSQLGSQSNKDSK